jgi:hypothetical protein
MKINKNLLQINREQKVNETFMPLNEIVDELKQIYSVSNYGDTNEKIENLKLQIEDKKNILEQKNDLQLRVKTAKESGQKKIESLDYNIYNLKLEISEKLGFEL